MTALLDEPLRTLLRAATRDDEIGLAAFKHWRSTVRLDDIDYSAHRVMPMLVDRARGHGIIDPDLERMRGITRHIWTVNIMHLQNLFRVLDALGEAGIRPLLLKGAALFARQPQLSSKRMSSDYDFLVPNGALPRAIEALAAADFTPASFDWQVMDQSVLAGETSGTGLLLRGKRASVDFHWRPLSTLEDWRLTDRLADHATALPLRDREVLVPSLTHHLFLSVARCEPYDQAECFQRLIEGHLLLSGPDVTIDWSEFGTLTFRYGLEAIAASYLGLLKTETDADIPGRLIRRFARRAAGLKRIEFRSRRTPPERRTPLQRWMLGWTDARYHRSHDSRKRLLLHDALVERSSSTKPWRMRAIWRRIRNIHRGPSTGYLRFLDGWHYPERRGRWSRGRIAALAVPLTDDQRSGSPVRLKIHFYFGDQNSIDIQVTTGGNVLAMTFVRSNEASYITLEATPCSLLGGDALVVFWLPFGISPFENGSSNDQRILGLFLHNDEPPAGSPVSAAHDMAPQR